MLDLTSSTAAELIDTEVSLADLHSVDPQPSLERNGLKLVKFELPLNIDWGTANAAWRVHVRVPSATSVTGHGKPVARVHVDYTAGSARDKLTALLPEEAEKLMKRPWAIVQVCDKQVWKPLIGPVQKSPLGLIDAATVHPQDLHPYTLFFPGKGGDTIGVNGGGESYAVLHNPRHRWLYAKDMSADEAYLFLSFDSRGDGRARFTPHTEGDLCHKAAAAVATETNPTWGKEPLRSYRVV
ncbi:hypothetical protein ABBQ38_009018 [Trebouxia sp. C0009 RCD-2024]